MRAFLPVYDGAQNLIKSSLPPTGHPLGATGARQVATGLGIAKRTGGKIFVTSMCVGSGMVSPSSLT